MYQSGGKELKVDYKKLDRAFKPKTVVVVGDGKTMGYMWVKGQKEFKGKLYSVHVNPESAKEIEAMGVKNYTSLMDIPEEIDLVIVAAPRGAALSILDDCIKKGVNAAHFFTAGFSETGTEEGIELERQLKEKAEAANFHLIGPNCMGLFNPNVGIKQRETQYSGISGTVGFISQSGTHAILTSEEARYQGVLFNKSVSFGNGTVIDVTDYLEYYGQDPEIEVVGMYLEGVRDGPRFLKVLKEVTAKKPVLIWKGGRTEEGGRAIASHTGSLAASMDIWNAAMRQCGAIQAPGADEFVDTLKVLLFLPPVTGSGVGIAGGSGGQSVDIADVFSEAGLKVPPLTQKSKDEFATFFSLVGGSYSNPIDIIGGNSNRQQMRRCMEILRDDENIDNLVLLLSMHFIVMTRGVSKKQVEANVSLMSDLRKENKKPVMTILTYATAEEMMASQDIVEMFQDEGVPVLPSVKRGAFALSNALEYYRLKSAIGS
jgi:acyl-CoA synthetase (NDP forming)